jgi:hypothetical protein
LPAFIKPQSGIKTGTLVSRPCIGVSVMPQRSAQDRALHVPLELQQSHWCGIGIHAVAAASIYCHQEAKRRVPPAPRTEFGREADYATD